MKVVVLGASGNAGNRVLRALEAEPRVEDVVAVARRPPATWAVAQDDWRSLDVARDRLEPVVRGADVVVHLAWLIQPARDLEQCRAVNVDRLTAGHGRGGRAGVPRLSTPPRSGRTRAAPRIASSTRAWPTGGVPTSFYSRHKVEVERLLDGFEARAPDVRVVRLPPA